MVSDTLPRVAVVILNWNGRGFLQQFLPIVLKHSAGCRIIVADNASADDSVAWLKENFPSVGLIQHLQNLGFCEGYNQALLQVTADYYVLLNSDVEVTTGWLDPMIRLLESDAAVAACQPKIKSFIQRNYFEYAGAGGGFIDYLGYPFCRGRLFDTLEEDQGQYDDVTPIFWASGACMVVRAAAYWQANGLEPAFFAHMEEIDLCWRLQQMHYKIMYCGHSEVYHVGGGTLPQGNPRKVYLNFRNGLALLVKNLAPAERWRVLPLRILLDWVAAAKFTVDGQLSTARAIFRAHWHVWQQRKYWQSKHSRIHHSSVYALIYPRSIVWQYFIKKKSTYKELNIPDRTALPA